MEAKETWQNVSKHQVYVKVLDTRGQDKTEHVRPGAKVSLTPMERRINQDLVHDKAMDFFSNGTLTLLRPIPEAVRLVEDAEDYKEIANNPNLLSDSDIRDLFKLPAAKFKSRIADIANLQTVQRVYEVSELEEVDSSMSQVKALEARIEALTPKLAMEQIEVENHGPVGGSRS